MLAMKDIRVVVTGSEEEINIANDLIDMARSKVINAVGETTIMQLAALLKRCKVFVTSDSAPMHIASAMGTSFVALFGPTDSRRHFEPTERGVVIHKKVNCGPCYKSDCKKVLCMERISVDEVFKAVMEKLEDRKT
jgi:ADP-heptose:LPS heptosyltransferase